MKFLSRLSLFAIAATLSVYAATSHAQDRNSYGLGVTYDSGIYFGQDGYAELFPMIDAKFGDFFIKNKVVGWKGFKHNNIAVSLIASRNDYYLDTSEINSASDHIFLGIEGRDKAIEVGFLYEYASPVGDLSWEYFKDISDKHGGMHNTVRFARPSGNPNLISFTPSIYVHYFSSAFNDYYYGIDATENENGLTELNGRLATDQQLSESQFEDFRPQYGGQNSGHLGFDIWIKKPYTQNLVGVFYAAWEEVLGEVENSSLVEDDSRLTFRLGIEYRL